MFLRREKKKAKNSINTIIFQDDDVFVENNDDDLFDKPEEAKSKNIQEPEIFEISQTISVQDLTNTEDMIIDLSENEESGSSCVYLPDDEDDDRWMNSQLEKAIGSSSLVSLDVDSSSWKKSKNVILKSIQEIFNEFIDRVERRKAELIKGRDNFNENNNYLDETKRDILKKESEIAKIQNDYTNRELFFDFLENLSLAISREKDKISFAFEEAKRKIFTSEMFEKFRIACKEQLFVENSKARNFLLIGNIKDKFDEFQEFFPNDFEQTEFQEYFHEAIISQVYYQTFFWNPFLGERIPEWIETAVMKKNSNFSEIFKEISLEISIPWIQICFRVENRKSNFMLNEKIQNVLIDLKTLLGKLGVSERDWVSAGISFD